VLSPTSQKHMNAAVFLEPNKISNTQVQLYDQKSIENAKILRVKACAVCSYDVRVFRNGHEKVNPPVILGHEICAEVVDDLELVGGLVIPANTRVAVSPLVPCLRCPYCSTGHYNLCSNLRELGSSIDGGFAEYIQVPNSTLQIGGIIPIPSELNDTEASLLEPLACCINSLSRLPSHSPDEDRTICIIGDGPIGLIHLKLFNLAKTKCIVIGKIESRMKAAKSMGAHEVLLAHDRLESTAKEVFDLTNGIGPNLVIIAASNPDALGLATRIASKNAQISLFAGMPKNTRVSLDSNWLHYNQVSLIGSFSAIPDSLRQAISFVAEHQITLSDLVSHCYSLSNIEKALAATESCDCLRNVINEF
jgi:L-iditol 2-dehydrogenase